MEVVIIITLGTALIFAWKWGVEKIKVIALVYYLVEKGYTEPTREEMERCIKIAVEKSVNGWSKK